MKETIVITYPGRAYGTYLEWALTTLMNTDPIKDPAGPRGSNHEYKGVRILDMADWDRYARGTKQYQFVRMHPNACENEAWIQNQLLKHGYQLKCHALDFFPTHSLQLKELLYRL